MHLTLVCGGHLLSMDGLTQSMTVMAFWGWRSHTDQAYIPPTARAEEDEPPAPRCLVCQR